MVDFRRWLSRSANLKISVPPGPIFLLQHPEQRKLYHPLRDPTHDSSLATLYRIYAAIISREDLRLRSEIEYFFNHADWAVKEIPDPKDVDLERYAVVAAIPFLLVPAFNRLIDKGLARGAPAIMCCADLEAFLNGHEKVLETVPLWAERLQPLQKALLIPDSRGMLPAGPEDDSADTIMLGKNIITTHLPIFFV